jgi:ribosomal protein L40E
VKTDWRKVPCKKCGRKGLHHPMHPHAMNFHESGKLVCRFCGARFIIKNHDDDMRIKE